MIKTFGDTILVLGKKYKNMVVLTADFTKEFNLTNYISENRYRHFNFGLTPGNMVSAACGMLVRGKLPLICSVSDFLVGNALSQINNDICFANLNVKFVGISGEIDAMNDVKILSNLKNMEIFQPDTEKDLVNDLKTMFEKYGPCYLSLKKTVL